MATRETMDAGVCHGDTSTVHMCSGGPGDKRNRYVSPAKYDLIRSRPGIACATAERLGCFFGNQFTAHFNGDTTTTMRGAARDGRKAQGALWTDQFARPVAPSKAKTAGKRTGRAEAADAGPRDAADSSRAKCSERFDGSWYRMGEVEGGTIVRYLVPKKEEPPKAARFTLGDRDASHRKNEWTCYTPAELDGETARMAADLRASGNERQGQYYRGVPRYIDNRKGGGKTPKRTRRQMPIGQMSAPKSRTALFADEYRAPKGWKGFYNVYAYGYDGPNGYKSTFEHTGKRGAPSLGTAVDEARTSLQRSLRDMEADPVDRQFTPGRLEAVYECDALTPERDRVCTRRFLAASGNNSGGFARWGVKAPGGSYGKGPVIRTKQDESSTGQTVSGGW